MKSESPFKSETLQKDGILWPVIYSYKVSHFTKPTFRFKDIKEEESWLGL
jgi:hypothetical protein